ncbi:MAG: hypothetical protein LCI00_00905 [Chloroflexi bacterium]|nr:hypothetical protein [Chloroflexota bacterium]MCC6896990.1 hypothetical protein [Anaerolineae bacterium]
MDRFWRIGVTGLLCCAAACTPTAQQTVEPTQTLIVMTPTVTPIPITPTITLTPLPRAGDLPTPTPFTAGASDDFSPEDDLVAAELVALAQRRVAETLNLPVRRVQVVEVKSYTWLETSLGCPTQDTTYPEQEVDGYRIVLSANDEQYIFHTDFDRVVACDPANEQLPPSSDSE